MTPLNFVRPRLELYSSLIYIPDVEHPPDYVGVADLAAVVPVTKRGMDRISADICTGYPAVIYIIRTIPFSLYCLASPLSFIHKLPLYRLSKE